jgi:hypothetical protein
MANFLGIKQSRYSEYLAVKTNGQHLGYLWLITNEDGEGNKIDGSYDIYFGSRKYSENGVVYHNLINTFGGLMDDDGAFVFPVGEETFLTENANDADNLYQLLKALDAAINANKTAFDNYYTETQVDGLVNGVKALLNNYATGVTVTVGGSTYTGALTNNVVNVDLSDAFEAAGKVKDVTVDGKTVMSGTTAVIDLSGKANVGDAYTKAEADAKFLTGVTIPEYTIEKQATPESGYAATYYLTKDGKQIGEKINTTLDQVLKNSAILTVEETDQPYAGAVVGDKYVKFEFHNNNTPQYLPVKDLVDVYTGSTSIDVSANNVISVKEVDAEKINVEEIPVGGTPLADILLDNDITSITANNLQEVLNSLFSQNLWAENPRRIVPTSLGVSMNNPSITFTPTATTVEVGTEISVSASAANASASASITYTGFTYGYSVAKDNTKDGDTPASVAITGTKNTNSNYKLTFTTNNGFGKKDLADANAQTISSVENYDNKLIVEEGTNKVTVYATSPTFSATVPAQNAIYACSSLKKTDDDHVVAASSATTISGATVTKNNNDSVTGAYKFYIGTSANEVTTSDNIKKLSKTAWSNGGNNVTLISSKTEYAANNYVVIAVPKAYKIKEAVNSFNLDGMIFGSPNEVDYYLPNNTPIKYNVYNAFIGEPYGFNKIVIGK